MTDELMERFPTDYGSKIPRGPQVANYYERRRDCHKRGPAEIYRRSNPPEEDLGSSYAPNEQAAKIKHVAYFSVLESNLFFA